MNEMQKKELLNDAEEFEAAVDLALNLCKIIGSNGKALGSMTGSLANITVMHLNDYLQKVMKPVGGCRMAQAVACTVLAKQFIDALAEGDKKAELEKWVEEMAVEVKKEMEPRTKVIKTSLAGFKKEEE